MEITNINQLDFNKTYTYADYLLWKFKERVELIKGKIIEMSPAPSTNHQRISVRLTGVFYELFHGKKCEVFSAPFDVRLPIHKSDSDKIHTVVQPDLCIVCDPNKLDDKGCIGAPDLVVEILSPSNSKREMKDKFDLYEEAGVQEYWIVFPTEEMVLVNVLENGKYKTLRPIADDVVSSVRFPELKIHTDKIFK